MSYRNRETQRLSVLHSTKLLDTPPEPSFDRLTRLASNMLSSPVALVSLVDSDRQFFKSHSGLAEPMATLRQTPLSHSFCKLVVRERAPLSVQHASEDPRVRDNPAIETLGVQAYLGTPLIIDDEAIGSFCVVDVCPRVWTEREEAILADLAECVATEIRMRAAVRDAREQRAFTAALLNGVRDAVLAVDSELNVLFANKAAVALFPDYQVGRELPPTMRESLRAKRPDGTYVASADLPLARAARGEAFEASLITMQLATKHEKSWLEVTGNAVRDEQGVAIAGLVTYKDVTQRQNELEELVRTRRLLESQADALRTTAITDELTGLCNRRGFMVLADRESKTSIREQRPLVLFFIDLDGLKQINDNLGHELGDKAIIAAAGVLRRVFRDADILARLGGDEFAVLAADSSDDAPIRERIEHALTLANSRDELPFRLAMSVGSATFDPRNPTTIDALLALADARMYEQKMARKGTR